MQVPFKAVRGMVGLKGLGDHWFILKDGLIVADGAYFSHKNGQQR